MATVKQEDDRQSSGSSLLTFLIADVRGYTRFTVERGDEAAARLATRFADLCEETAGHHNGRVIELRGDEALLVFPSARDALRGAVALQDAFHAAGTEDPSLPLHVGVGLDAGDAIPVKGGYRGGALNLAARLCSIAGGGEILASETVIGLARKTEGLAFVDRGQVTLKGLAAPIRVLQIAPEGSLPNSLPPLQPILATHPTNLPDPATSFIGRESEIGAVAGLLRRPDVRLVTLTGPGGTGKTRLALQVGSSLLYDFTDGVFFCDLAPLGDAALVPLSVASVLGVHEQIGRDLLGTVSDHLGERHLLLVLDNFEHLLDAASLVGSLLDGCRNLHVLVTSRIPLHLSREHEYPVPPLGVPDPIHLPDLDRFSQYESVALFIQRAEAVKPGFAITNESAPAVAEICARLDGLPLAIELAASRIKLFPPQALLQRLDSRLKLLTGGARDKPTRQQTLRGAIDWSYSLLTRDEQTLFARLSIFAGGWSFEPAEVICNSGGELDLIDGLASLVDKSLIRPEGEGEPRFSMLETIREYATEKLSEMEELERVARLHAEYYATLAEDAHMELRGTNQAEWFRRLDSEMDNFRSALDWTLERGEIELGLRIAGHLGWFWVPRARYSEGLRWLKPLLAAQADVRPTVRAMALWEAACMMTSPSDIGHAVEFTNEALHLYEEAGDTVHRTRVLNAVAMLKSFQGDPGGAIPLMEECIASARALDDRYQLSQSMSNLGMMLVEIGQVERGIAQMEEGASVHRERGDMYNYAGTVENIARGRYELGDMEGAQRDWGEALRVASDHGIGIPIPYCLEGFASVSARRGKAARAARLLGAAQTIRDERGSQLPPTERRIRDLALKESKQHLAEDEWRSGWDEGTRMTEDQAISFALGEHG